MEQQFFITRRGKDLILKLLVPETLEITRAWVGGGKMDISVDPTGLTDLIAPVAQATSTVPVVYNHQLEFLVQYRNDLNGGLETGFWINEFGVFALDPDVGEILLYYGTLGGHPQWVSSYDSGAFDVRSYPVSIGLSDDVFVELRYPALAFLTGEDLDLHNTSPVAHGASQYAVENTIARRAAGGALAVGAPREGLDGSGDAVRRVDLELAVSGILGGLQFQGSWDAGANLPELPGTPAAPGMYWLVSAAGEQFGISFAAGDYLVSGAAGWERLTPDFVQKVVFADFQQSVESRLSAAINRIYTSRDLTVTFASEIAAAPFSGDEWAWFQNRTQAGNFAGIFVGDYIPLPVAGIVFAMEIVGINTYIGHSDFETRNHVDFISRELWPAPIQWNVVNYNNGLQTEFAPFLTSNVFAFLNGLQMPVPNGTGADPATLTVDFRGTGIFPQLPAELRNVIVQRRDLLPRRYSAGLLLIDDNNWDWRNNGLLWLPSEMEVCGATVWGGVNAPNQGNSSGGYVQYPIFAETMKRAKRRANDSARNGWWLSTPSGGVSTRVSTVDVGGAASSGNTSGASCVPICFRIS